MPWDGLNAYIFNAPDTSTYQPWKGSIKGWKTCTADMCGLLDEAKEKNITIDKKFIAKTLVREQWLHRIHTIQISANNRFVLLEFKMEKYMESFCIDGLNFDNLDTAIYSKPDYKQRLPNKRYLHVSFLNVPGEADQDKMTRFVEQFFTVVGDPFYPKEDYDGITYYTCARVYKCRKEVIDTCHVTSKYLVDP